MANMANAMGLTECPCRVAHKIDIHLPFFFQDFVFCDLSSLLLDEEDHLHPKMPVSPTLLQMR